MTAAIRLDRLSKSYRTPQGGSFQALKDVELEIQPGEIFALLGPNGAGKTTLISAVCGLVQPTSGTITVGGFDTLRDWRQARSLIGLVPQELVTEAFENVWQCVSYSRGLFGLGRNDTTTSPQPFDNFLSGTSATPRSWPCRAV